MLRQKGQTRLHLPSARADGGQVLLIVVLAVIVALTIGLSVATRSITSIRTSTEEAESQKALAAAEAGIERAIQGSVPIALSLQNVPNSEGGGTNSTYRTSVDQVDSSSFLLNGGNVIPKDEGLDIWIVRHDSNNNPIYSDVRSLQNINLYWGSSSNGCGDAAIEAIVVSRDPSPPNQIKSYRYTYDGCDTRRAGNNFGDADVNPAGHPPVAGVSFTNRTAPQNDLAKNINDIVFMRVVPIYKDAAVAVSACKHDGTNCADPPLPIQGYKITSTGTSGQANRKLTVFKGYPQTYLPYLSYGLFVAN